jgi:hypothetical protein
MGPHEEILKQDLFHLNSLSSEARLVPIVTIEQEPLTSLCLRMREKLETNHVICPEVRASELCQALRDQDLTVRAVLQNGFYKLLTVEVSSGLDDNGRFDHDGHFLPYMREVLYSYFGVDPTEDYHPEQVVQVVKDEEPSLFCFLDAQHIQGSDVQRLRIFTQGRHRVLICALPVSGDSTISQSAIVNSGQRLSHLGGFGDPTSERACVGGSRPKLPEPSVRGSQDETQVEGRVRSILAAGVAQFRAAIHSAVKTLRRDGAANATQDSKRDVPNLRILSGPLADRLFTLDRDVTIIGCDPHCDVVLQSTTVSRRHAAIDRSYAGFWLKDIGSTRGTYLHGEKVINPVMLQDGEIIQIGEFLLVFSGRPEMAELDEFEMISDSIKF